MSVTVVSRKSEGVEPDGKVRLIGFMIRCTLEEDVTL